jgi:TolB-like protein/DNA-binding winged helix-turn-helix (wHTH) protein/tetratricopeptide (TPR) repeat protein
MIFRFGPFTLNTETCELKAGGVPVAIEPQVLALLQLLIRHRDRLVTKDEIVAQVWNGRIVSDSAISSRIKSLRRALGDDGRRQAFVRTAPKLGFRFVAEVEPAPAFPRPAAAEDGAPGGPGPGPGPAPTSRPSIAVLPFAVIGAPGPASAMAEALPHDLIVELSRLRWLFVIARGSSFRFPSRAVDLAAVRAALGAAYVLSGAIEAAGRDLRVTVELADAASGGVIWSEGFRFPLDGVHEVRAQVARAVTGALDLQIPLHEARRAGLVAPDRLDAWSAFHLGLRHMFRFDREGNRRAGHLFRRAVELDPGFARAHAGLSFVQFEDAFLRFAEEPDRARTAARAHAERSLERDPLDPFCNLVMGRVHWLDGDLEASLPWLERAIRLNPNYAQAKYSLAWTETLLGDGAAGRVDAEAALRLSPLDPLAYGMIGVHALSFLQAGEPGPAAAWGERAARAPGAHALIEMIAAVAHALNGDEARAKACFASSLRRNPELSADEFLRAFPFREPAARRRILAALRTLEG